MRPTPRLTSGQPIRYLECDGKPIAENTRQLQWILPLFDNLVALFRDRQDVFVASDLFRYPVEGQPEVRTAPDVLVAFGRPKGHRPSYKQWEEGNVPAAVVVEVLSPGSTVAEMDDKLVFYEDHGVEEYYILDPDFNRLMIYVRRGEVLVRVRPPHGFVSPRMGIRFDLSGPEISVAGPDGQRFRSYEELQAERDHERRLRVAAEQRAARLAELSRKARRGQATPEELQELERLEEQPSEGGLH